MRTHPGLKIRATLEKFHAVPLDWIGRVMRRPDGTPMSPDEMRAALQEKLAQGHEYLALNSCNNWDWKKGCLGHPDEVFDPERQPSSGGESVR